MRILLIFLCCLMGQRSMSQITPDQVAYNHRYEEVLEKNQVERSYWVVKKSDTDLKPGDTLLTFHYNSQGRTTKMRFTSPFADSEFLTEYKYKPNNKLWFLVSSTDYEINETHFSYSEDDVCIGSKTSGPSPEESRYIIENGRPIERQVFMITEATTDLDGVAVPASETIVQTFKYTYNEAGQCTGEVFYYLNEPVATTSYSYNPSGLMVKHETIMAQDETTTMYQQFIYNDIGLLKNVISSDMEGQITYFDVIHVKR